MTEQRGSGRVLASLTAGIVIGIVEIVLASFGSKRTSTTAWNDARTSSWKVLEPEETWQRMPWTGPRWANSANAWDPYLERLEVSAGSLVIRQGDRPDDVFLLESGRLRVEMTTHDGHRLRLRTMRAGVVVGEVALYTGAPRTADVVAETPSTILRLSRASL